MSADGGNGVARKRRSDYEQNRETILTAADAAFAEHGMATSIAKVAERAGVVPATVYRHFPARADLVDAVFLLRLREYCDAIDAAQETGEPAAAFRATIHAIVELQSRDRSFREIMTSRGETPWLDPAVVQFGTSFLGAVDAARSAGVLREGITEADVMVLLIATEGIARSTFMQSPPTLERLVDIVVDGLIGERSKLSGDTLAFEQILGIARNS